MLDTVCVMQMLQEGLQQVCRQPEGDKKIVGPLLTVVHRPLKKWRPEENQVTRTNPALGPAWVGGSGLTLAASEASHSSFLTYSPHTPVGWGQRIGRAKVRKVMGEDKNNLIREGKRKKEERKKPPPAKIISDEKAITHHLPQVHRYPASPQALATHPENTLSSIFIAEHDAIWHGISVWSVPVTFPGCVPSRHLAHPQPTHWGSE